MSTLIGKLPPGVIRFAGKLEHSVPLLSPMMRRAVRSMQLSDGVVVHGEAQGLRFNPAGTNPGYALGTSEPFLQTALADLLRTGMTFYDIGANVGFFSVLGAHLVGPSGSVHAFEPLPANARALAHNVELNGFTNVALVEAAVGREPGQTQLAVTAESVQAHLASIAADVPTLRTIDVALTTIDDEVAAGRPAPQLVKIDVEGAELAVLEGMTATLEEHKPVVICELHSTHAEVFDFFDGRGFRLGTLEGVVESIRTHAEPLHLLAEPA
jgi:FkbM family methyltransferase